MQHQLQEYQDSNMAAVVPVNNETEACLTRTTQDGRELLYDLKVIQQPERARACGSGAKCMSALQCSDENAPNVFAASADRRPVDPPPVVELKVYEGEEKKDVTFSHNANFFLFTTLEPARKIAHGRVPQTQAMAPVLTGAPVAGMVYLDRPSPAGYFIFPDLSVRHEGQYRLSFSLYEDVKEDKDSDNKPACSPKKMTSNSMAPRAHVHFRLEVKSIPFFVFSAKKFPGLSESTVLSRQVAEQGCRVRIRRDIRVRRRDNKATDGYLKAGEEGHYGASERFSTPQHMPDRPRSVSNGSGDAQTPYSLQRRPSMEMSGYYPSSAYAPPNPSASTHSANSYSSSHLNFGSSGTPTYQASTYQKSTMGAPLPPPKPQQYPPPANSSQYPSTFHSRQLSAPHNYTHHPAPQPQTSYGPSQTYKEERQPAPETRRASVSTSVNREPRQMYDSYVSNHPVLQQHNMASQAANRDVRSLTPLNTSTHNPPNTLPPLTAVLQGPPIDQPPSPASDASGMPRGPQNPYSSISLSSIANSTVTPQSSTSTYSTLPTPYSATSDPIARLNKRPYGNSFDTSHLNAPQHSGMRPDPKNHARVIQKIETDDGELQDLYAEITEQLMYKRANGTLQSKHYQSRNPANSQ